MNQYRIGQISGAPVGEDHYVTDAITQEGQGSRTHFFGSFADCWAWIQYQEYSVLDAQIAAHGRKK